MDFEDLKKHIDRIMDEQNNRSIPGFEGYSPLEMHQILYFPFGSDSPIKLQKLADEDFAKCPMFNSVKYLLDLIESSGEMKLTAKGFLPTKIVKDIYAQGFLEEYQFSSGLSKLYKESDSLTINLTRILAELSGLAKKRKGKLSLTKAGLKAVSDHQKLLEAIFKTMTQKFNWAYYDRYKEEEIGQFGFGFSLMLLSKYGAKKRLNHFYAEKYFEAFPQLLASIEPTYATKEEYGSNCYSVRTFERFLRYFGLTEIEKQKKSASREAFILRTELFDKFIKVQPPKSGHKK